MHRRTLLLLAVLPSAVAAQEPGFVGHRWTVMDIRGVAASPGIVSDLTLAPDGAAYGTGGCNRIRGGWTAEGAAGLRLGPMASTMMACEVAKAMQERRFLDALAEVRSWRVEATSLLLSDAAGAVVLRLGR